MLFFIIKYNFLEWLGKFEGFSAMPYLCPANKLTIGYGHVIKKEEVFKGYSGEFLINCFTHRDKIFNNFEFQITLKESFKNLITKQEALSLLEKDVLYFLKRVTPLVDVELKEHQIQALLSFIYNIGVSAFKNSTMLKYLNLGDFTRVAKEFERWVYIGKKFSQGLAMRRQKEKALFEGKVSL